MEPIGFNNVLKILADFGLVGLIVYLWWADNKRIWTVMGESNKQLMTVLHQYEKDMIEQREMYRANASLCRDFASIATDLRDIVTMNIQRMTLMDDAIRQNQFCPMVRIDMRKQKIGISGHHVEDEKS
jgi:hypothetical protein